MYKQKRIISGVEYTTLFVEVPIILKKFLKRQTAEENSTIKDLVLNSIFDKYQKDYFQFIDENKARVFNG